MTEYRILFSLGTKTDEKEPEKIFIFSVEDLLLLGLLYFEQQWESMPRKVEKLIKML